MSNREKATNEILKWVEKIAPKSGNKEMYQERLSALSDKEFENYMKKLASGEETLSLTIPNLSKSRISLERNLNIAKELGYSFFERLWLTDPHSGATYLTPLPYLVLDLPLRRQAQRLDKKISIPESSDTVEVLTGQATGPSKGAAVSFPELQVLHAQGLDKTIEELIKFRGGDEVSFREMNRQLHEKGVVNISQIQTGTRVKSTETLSTYLKAMHIQNNL